MAHGEPFPYPTIPMVSTATKKNPQDATRKVQGKRDRGQDAKMKALERRVKELEKAVYEHFGLTLGPEAKP